MTSTPSKPSVLLIISGFAIEGPLGGIERFGVELAKQLHTLNISVTVLGMWAYEGPNERRYLESLSAIGIEAIMPSEWDEASPYRSFLDCVQASRRILRGRSFDVIHSHCQFGDGLAILLGRQLSAKKLIRTVHNEKEWPRKRLRRIFLTNIWWPLRYDVEMGVSQQIVDQLDRRPLPQWLGKRAKVAYNSIDLDRFFSESTDPPFKPSRFHAKYRLPDNAVLVGSVGRLNPQKGFEVLVDAAAHIAQSRDDIYFLVAGGGPLLADLEAHIVRVGLTERFIMCGPINDIKAFYQSLDLFVSSSHWEGLSTVIMESLACGVPVVATRVSGSSEIIQDKTSGRLVPPGRPIELADAILEVLGQPNDEISQMVEAAQTHIQDHFTIQASARFHRSLYSSN